MKGKLWWVLCYLEKMDLMHMMTSLLSASVATEDIH